jgi:hypothetical protein
MSAVETTSTEKNNANVNSPQKTDKRKWLADAFVIVFCVTGAVFSLNLFRLDLFQSIATQNKKPMGAVTVKYNNVQRRFSDRVLWSRLTVKSPVYLGDLIRVAEYSSATLNINDGIIDINENSLIRIRTSSDGEDRVVIDLNSGSLSITGSDTADSGVALSVMGRVIAPTAKATLSASAKESGITLQVNEGSAIIIEEGGQSRSIGAGEALILDNKGVEQASPMAVVMLPRPNARLIKNNVEPLNIRFVWNAINIDQKKPLRLEIAAGHNFKHIVQTAEGIDFTNVALGAGTWYWRLLYQDTVLSSGQFTIIDTAMSAPTSPIQDNADYREDTPIRFEWQPIEEASYYIIEAGLTPDIKNPLITKQTAIASYVESNMKAGTWYWRVKPVFSSQYEGTAAFSQVSSFNIEKIKEPAAVAQTTDNSPAESIQSEPETKSAVTAKTDKSANSAKPVNPVTSSATNTAALVDSASNYDLFVSPNSGWFAFNDANGSKSNISISREIIDGIEKEVLTINVNLVSSVDAVNGNRWVGASTKNKEILQKLKNANGVRFKILGDGNKWEIDFPTTDIIEGDYHMAIISTKKGIISNINISFNKLRPPDWSTYNIGFRKNNLTEFKFERNLRNGSGNPPVASIIKVFDFEVY